MQFQVKGLTLPAPQKPEQGHLSEKKQQAFRFPCLLSLGRLAHACPIFLLSSSFSSSFADSSGKKLEGKKKERSGACFQQCHNPSSFLSLQRFVLPHGFSRSLQCSTHCCFRRQRGRDHHACGCNSAMQRKLVAVAASLHRCARGGALGQRFAAAGCCGRLAAVRTRGGSAAYSHFFHCCRRCCAACP